MLEENQKAKIQALLNRIPELEEQLGNPELLSDPKKFKKTAQEHAYLKELEEAQDAWISLDRQLRENRQLLRESLDEEMESLVKEEITLLEERLPDLEKKIDMLLVPPDPYDHANTILEIRAGTGGDEAALFVGTLVRMYKLYADAKGWRWELLSCTPSDLGGFKEYIVGVAGPAVYRLLRHEAGTHRVQRVPETEAQGRVHTSAATVAVLLEPPEDEDLRIDEKDLRIDTCRSSGAGGQHVNTTDSAVRITHLPTGVVVFCQEERSQIKNREKAMRVLKVRIREAEIARKAAEVAELRSSQVGSGDRSERIRTYNFPQNRVTDHRIGLTLYNLDRMLNGDLDPMTLPLVAHYHKVQLEAVGL